MKYIKKWFSLKNIIMTIAEFIIAIILVLTFAGDEFIGFNLPIYVLLVAIALYLVYPVYKFVLKIFDDVEEAKGNRK